MSFSNYLEGALLDHLFGIVALGAPQTWVALSTADPTEDGTGLAEPVGGGYARVQVAAWTRSGSRISNTNQVQFPEASGSWGTITHFAVVSASVGGNVLFRGSLSPARAVNVGDTLFFAADGLGITLD